MKKTSVKAKKTSGAKKIITRSVRKGLERIADNVMKLFSSQPRDLVEAIEQDHDGLRQFIGVLKDTKRDMTERRKAYELFSTLLKSHTIAEENVVYNQIEDNANADLVIRIEEGFVEHQVAKDVMARMEKVTDPVIWSAHANVVAELVEHHLDEEEEKMFPMIRKQISKKLEADLIMEFIELRASTQKFVTKKNSGVLEVLR